MIIPPKLTKGDNIRVISPARSLGILSSELREIAGKKLSDLGYNVSFATHSSEVDESGSSSIQSRIDDLHDAFRDPSIKLILTTIGGFNSNQLLPYIDYELIKKNPKILCGYSDITALTNAIYAKTGLVTYSGPHFSSFGEKKYFEYTQEYFNKCVVDSESFTIHPSESWSKDRWYKDQENRNLIKNDGYWVINEGKATGTIIGGNICTLNLLQGTEFMPSLKNSVVFIEDDSLSDYAIFDRDFVSLIQQADFREVKGIVIGRFEGDSQIAKEDIVRMIQDKKELAHIPVIANVDFGHTDPRITFPIGGTVEMSVNETNSEIKIVTH